MKARLLCLLLVFVLAILALASCGGNKPSTGNDDTDGNTNNNGGSDTGSTEDEDKPLPENTIYAVGSAIKILSADTSVTDDMKNEIYDALKNVGAKPGFANFAMAASEHEIILGNSERDISKKAYQKLSRIDLEEDYAAYVIYSDGKSIAVAFSHISACYYAVDRLLSEYFIGAPLVIKPGYTDSGSVSILDYLAEHDEAVKEKKWSILENSIDTDNASEIVAAIKELYAIHNPDVITWFANLYDPDIGGYYFSNSGRNTPGYLPDLESTSQALGFFDSTGMASHWTKVLPADMIKKIGEFAYNLQDPNGFFYHPQWTKALVDSKLSRRARDLNHGLSLIAAAGMTPKYESAIDQIEPIEPMSALTGRLGASSVVAVSKVIPTAEIDHLKSEEAFITYLRGLNIYNNSYAPGNQLSSQAKQIKAAGLIDVCLDYLESIQNPVNGLWEDKIAYSSINGLLKLSGIWSVGERAFPYAKEAVEAAMQVITSDEEPENVVVMYNCWYSIRNIFNSTSYGSDSDMQLVKDARAKLFELAPDAIRATMNKVKLCQKPDGSFSWSLKYSSATSQGCPVSVPNTVEGDVNATVIGIGGTINNMYHALGLSQYRVNIFGERELYIYLKTLEGLGSIEKDDTIFIGEPFDFESADLGSVPTDVTVKSSVGSSIVVELDPEDEFNKVVHIISPGKGNPYNKDGNADTIYVPNTVGMAANCNVFEGDFYIKDSTSGYFMQVTMDKCYMFTLQTDDDGNVKLIDASSSKSSLNISNTYNVTLKPNTWFHVKIEYYAGDKNTVRIKAYVDDELVAITDNFFDQTGDKFYGLVEPGESAVETRLYCMMERDVDMYVDNLHTYRINQPYTAEDPVKGTPNVDSPDKEALVYDFEDGLPEDIVVFDGTYKIGDNSYTYSGTGVELTELNGSGALRVNTDGKVAKLEIPTTVRTSVGNCGTLGFDIKVDSAELGDFAVVKFYDKNGGANSNTVIMGITLSCIEEDGEKYIVLREMQGGTVGNTLEGFKVKLGEIVNVRFEFYHSEDATLIFLNNVSASASYALFAGGYKYTLGYASLETSASIDSDVYIDNVKCERIVRDFATATLPTGARNVLTFDSSSGVTVGQNASITSEGDNKVLLLGNGGKASIPVNHRSTVVSIATLETLIAFKSCVAGGELRVSFVDESDEIVFGLCFVGCGSTVELRELTRNGVAGNVIATLSANTKYTLKVEICPSRESANIYLNGTAVFVTNVFYDEPVNLSKIVNMNLESEKLSAYIDNTYVEAVNSAFTAETPEFEANKENTADKLTFESSTSYNLPKHVTTDLSSSGAAVRIKSLLYGETLTNVLAFTTTAGKCDTLSFGIMNVQANSSCYAFEADIKLDFPNDMNVFQFRFSSAYMLTMKLDKNGNVVLGDCSAASGSNRTYGTYAATGIHSGEWFKLRVEFYPGDKDSVRFKVYVNGELLGVSNNYYGYRTSDEVAENPAQSISKMYFYSLSSAYGTLYIDNVVTERIVKPVGSDELTINIEHH